MKLIEETEELYVNHTAVYYNRATEETYKIRGVRDLEQAWNLAEFVCNRNNWNLSMFCHDVQVKLIKK